MSLESRTHAMNEWMGEFLTGLKPFCAATLPSAVPFSQFQVPLLPLPLTGSRSAPCKTDATGAGCPWELAAPAPSHAHPQTLSWVMSA